MKPHLLGGPLLGTAFEPLMSDSAHQERYVFLPNERYIEVRAHRTGKQICSLTPESSAVIFSAVLSPLSLLVGTSDGTIQEFALADFSGGSLENDSSPFSLDGSYYLPGACVRPRRIFQVAEEGSRIRHLGIAESGVESLMVYALLEEAHHDNNNQELPKLRLIRTWLASDGRKSHVNLLEANDKLASVDDNVKIMAEKKQEMPFRMLVSSAAGQRPCETFVVLASRHSLMVYHEQVEENQPVISFPPVTFYLPPKLPLTTFAISPNNQDIACGHSSGSIRLLSNILPRVGQYCRLSRGNATEPHPGKGMIARKLHWHAHPVSSLVYSGRGGDAVLYSGGEESVLVTWQLSRGVSKPVEVLPRIALGGIVHMVGGQQPESVLLFCSDNSLHLYETHNQFRRWKVQGLAAGRQPSIFSTQPRLVIDRRTKKKGVQTKLLITGLSQVPGQIQVFDSSSREVVSSIEVAPYNRISRTEPGNTPLPSPTLTRCSWDSDGNGMITVDIAPTENQSVGASDKIGKDKPVGSVSTVRFWSVDEDSDEYSMVAAMSSPHGGKNHVSAVALSPDGNYACTVSNSEKAFRLWRRVEGENAKGTEWVCRFRVQIPSGLSNHETGAGAVSFSEDSSVLAIAFGHLVSLWDHFDVTLLTTLPRLDQALSPLHSVRFLKSGSFHDVLLMWSSFSVSLQSPFGTQGPVGVGWSWDIPSEVDAEITCVEHIDGEVCVVLMNNENHKSNVVFIDALTGEAVVKGEEYELIGKVTGLAGKRYETEGEDEGARVTLYALTDKGELVSFNKTNTQEMNTVSDIADRKESHIVRLPEEIGNSLLSRKRNYGMITGPDLIEDEVGEATTRVVSLENFGSFVGEPSSSTLPVLRGAFARSFVSRHLQRR